MTRVFIFDWDDTLLPSTWMIRLQKYYGTAVNALIQPFLDSLQDSVCALFDSAHKHGYTSFVITNSQSGWVELSASRHMPKVLAKLNELKIPIISAQTLYATANPDKFDPTNASRWKHEAFWNAIKDFEPIKKDDISNGLLYNNCYYTPLADSIFQLDLYEPLPKRSDAIELIVMGDCIFDINAAQSVNIYDWIVLKTIKLVESPDIQTLTRELTYLHDKFDSIATLDGEYSLSMRQILTNLGGLIIHEEVDDSISISSLPINFIPINLDSLQLLESDYMIPVTIPSAPELAEVIS